MRTRRSLISLVFPVLLLAACGDDGGDPTMAGGDETTSSSSTTVADEEGGGMALTIDDNGSSVEVAVGERIVVELESCPSCGYSWAQMGDEGTGGLELVSAEDTDPTAGEGQVGGSVTHVVTFEATAPGESQIALGYFPPAEDAPEEVFSVDVTITD